MTLQVPNLDDRKYDELAAEARGLIPKNFPPWTDHNPSDPGITLLEIFAFLLESAIYQINRVPERSLEHFAELSGITRGQSEPIEQTIRRTLDILKEKNRAITASDFGSQVITEFLNTKYVLASQPTLRQDHKPSSGEISAVLMNISPEIAVLSRNTDMRTDPLKLTLTSSETLQQNDVLMIDDDIRTEFVQLNIAPSGTGPITITINSPLLYDHSRDVSLKKVLSPIQGVVTTLASTAKTGDNIIILKPSEQMNKAGVIRIDSGSSTEYLYVQGVARIKILVDMVMSKQNVYPEEQFLKVVIVPNDMSDPEPMPMIALRQAVFRFLRLRGLITTRIKVVPPEYTPLDIETTVVRDVARGLDRNTVQQNVEKAIQDFLSPLGGGTQGKGWEFGRSVYRSELYQCIENIPGVDHVQQLLMEGDDDVEEKELISPISLVKLIKNDVKVVDN